MAKSILNPFHLRSFKVNHNQVNTSSTRVIDCESPNEDDKWHKDDSMGVSASTKSSGNVESDVSNDSPSVSVNNSDDDFIFDYND